MNLHEELSRQKKLMGLGESPDVIETNKGISAHRDDDCITFGYLNNTMYVSMLSKQNKNIRKSAHNLIPQFYFVLSQNPKFPKDAKHQSIINYVDDDESEPIALEREDFKYSGRIWANEGVISFWDYPGSLSEIKRVISDIQQEINVISGLMALPGKMKKLNITQIDIPVAPTDVYADEDDKSYQKYSNWNGHKATPKVIPLDYYDVYQTTY